MAAGLLRGLGRMRRQRAGAGEEVCDLRDPSGRGYSPQGDDPPERHTGGIRSEVARLADYSACTYPEVFSADDLAILRARLKQIHSGDSGKEPADWLLMLAMPPWRAQEMALQRVEAFGLVVVLFFGAILQHTMGILDRRFGFGWAASVAPLVPSMHSSTPPGIVEPLVAVADFVFMEITLGAASLVMVTVYAACYLGSENEHTILRTILRFEPFSQLLGYCAISFWLFGPVFILQVWFVNFFVLESASWWYAGYQLAVTVVLAATFFFLDAMWLVHARWWSPIQSLVWCRVTGKGYMIDHKLLQEAARLGPVYAKIIIRNLITHCGLLESDVMDAVDLEADFYDLRDRRLGGAKSFVERRDVQLRRLGDGDFCKTSTAAREKIDVLGPDDRRVVRPTSVQDRLDREGHHEAATGPLPRAGILHHALPPHREGLHEAAPFRSVDEVTVSVGGGHAASARVSAASTSAPKTGAIEEKPDARVLDLVNAVREGHADDLPVRSSSASVGETSAFPPKVRSRTLERSAFAASDYEELTTAAQALVQDGLTLPLLQDVARRAGWRTCFDLIQGSLNSSLGQGARRISGGLRVRICNAVCM